MHMSIAGILSYNLALFILLGAFDAFYLAHPATAFMCAAVAGWSVPLSLSLSGQLYDLISD